MTVNKLGRIRRLLPAGAAEGSGPGKSGTTSGAGLAWRRRAVLVTGISLVLLLAVVGLALGLHWEDVSDSILDDYGIEEAQLAEISQGYPDGTWAPYQTMPRRQFVKMALDAFQLPRVEPSTPTYGDVPPSHQYFGDIEGATAAGLVMGVAPGQFGPDQTVTREQAAAIISRFLVKKAGQTLPDLFTAEAADQVLAGFGDAAQVGPSLKLEMAFAVQQGILKGTTDLRLQPKGQLSRIQGAAMLIRAGSGLPTTTTTLPSTTTTVSSTTTTVSSTTTTVSPTTTTTVVGATTTTLPPVTTTTQAPPPPPPPPPPIPAVLGQVIDTDNRAVAGAQVRVFWSASNPNPPANRLIGSATTNAAGNFEVSMAGIPLGTVIDVSASASGYYAVLVFGPYDQVREVANFRDFRTSGGGDRRLRFEDPALPPPLLIFEGLLPD